MEQQPSSSRKGKRKAQERDLKSYFSPFGSSSTNPSTHGSEVGNAIIEEEEVVETHLEDTNTIGQQPGSNENDQGGLSWNEVQLNLVVMFFLEEKIKGAFEKNGLRNIIGWNIAW
ncbi:uncharacterized protein LOC120686896 [Panicum virgatum]|uniref:uncharacterized protein LOC120686896 n=1 Tax=Panicum virgatum TaxID=38727 RepID=UPI0019D64543|nr:uncharacterized protein LOC120686896 [Panicum virgatum]